MTGIIYEHQLTSGLIDTFVKMIQAVKEKGDNCVHPLRDMNLKPIAYANFQKLRYFGLMAKVREKKGFWLITTLGGLFLRNERAIPFKVSTQDNHIVGKSEEMRMIKDFLPMYDQAWFQSNWEGIDLRQPALL